MVCAGFVMNSLVLIQVCSVQVVLVNIIHAIEKVRLALFGSSV